MKNSNWMITDLNNKATDLIRYIKDHTIRLSEDRVLQIFEVKQMDYEEIKKAWLVLPDNYKTNNKNLGCA